MENPPCLCYLPENNMKKNGGCYMAMLVCRKVGFCFDCCPRYTNALGIPLIRISSCLYQQFGHLRILSLHCASQRGPFLNGLRMQADKLTRIHGTGIFTYIYHTNQPNVGIRYTIHGSYGLGYFDVWLKLCTWTRVWRYKQLDIVHHRKA